MTTLIFTENMYLFIKDFISLELYLELGKAVKNTKKSNFIITFFPIFSVIRMTTHSSEILCVKKKNNRYIPSHEFEADKRVSMHVYGVHCGLEIQRSVRRVENERVPLA